MCSSDLFTVRNEPGTLLAALRAFAGQKGRSFSATQSDAGERAPMVATSIEQAYVLLGLDYKAKFNRFEPET